MEKKIKIIGMTGSLRKASYNKGVLRYIEEIVPAGVEYKNIDVSNLPFYNEEYDETGYPDAVMALKEELKEADAVLLATPEYNYSIPPVLKNALDWVSRGEEKPLAGKRAALLSVTIGPLGGARVQYHLRQTLLALDVTVMNRPELFIANAKEKFDAEGNLQDEKTKKYTKRLLDALIEEIKKNK